MIIEAFSMEPSPSDLVSRKIKATLTLTGDMDSDHWFISKIHIFWFGGIVPKPLSAGTWAVAANLNDGTTHSVRFSLKGK